MYGGTPYGFVGVFNIHHCFNNTPILYETSIVCLISDIVTTLSGATKWPVTAKSRRS